MRTARFLAAIVVPLAVVACATATSPDVIGSSGDGGTSAVADSGYGQDEASTAKDSGAAKDSGTVQRDSGGGGGTVDSGGGGGGGGGGVTAGGDCIGDPGAPFGYDFACELAESLDSDSPCTSGANACGAGSCCFVDTSSMCFSDYGSQCVTAAM